MLPRLLFAFCLTLATGIAGEPSTAAWSGTARITFSGTSTLHDWDGTVRTRPFTLEIAYDPQGQPRHLRSHVVVAAAEMNTADKRRDAVMHRCLKVSDHPLIEAMIDVAAKDVAADGKTPTRLPMTLMLLGRPHPLQATVSDWQHSAEEARFHLDAEISLKAAGIEVPSVLWLIRVNDTIRLHADVRLTRP